MPNLWAMDVKKLLAVIAGGLALVSLFAGPALVLLAVAIIVLAVATVI